MQTDLHNYAATLGLHVDGFVMQHLLAPVQVLDKFRDAAVVFEFGGFRFPGLGVTRALIGQGDQQALVEKSQLAQSLGQRVKVIFGGRKNASIRKEVNLGAKFFARACLLQLAGRLAFGIALLPGESIAPDFQIEFFAQRVHAGNANPVQSTRNFVGRRVEFAAGVQLGHYHLRGWHLFAVDLHRVHRDTAAVIDHSDGIIQVNCDFDLVGVAGERFVHRIVHHLVDQMVQSHLTGRTDVHGGTFAHGFHAAQYLDGISGVIPVAPGYGGKLSVFWLDFVDGSDFFRGHSAPWKVPDMRS